MVSCLVARRSRKRFTGLLNFAVDNCMLALLEQAFLIIENMEKYGIDGIIETITMSLGRRVHLCEISKRPISPIH